MSEQSTPAPISEQPQIEYRDIPGFPGYRVGDDGSVWSAKAAKDVGKSMGYYKQLKGCVRPDGYRVFSLPRNGRYQSFLAHRIIALAFLGPAPVGTVCCHCNGNKLDNRKTNLRYDTQAGNIADKWDHGTMLCGEDISQSKLTEREVAIIRRLALEGVNHEIIAVAFGLGRREVGRIAAGERWAHVTT